MNYRPQPPTQESKQTPTVTEGNGLGLPVSTHVVDLSKIEAYVPTLGEQAIFLALLTGAMSKANVSDYDAKSTTGQSRVNKLKQMAKTIAEVYNRA